MMRTADGQTTAERFFPNQSDIKVTPASAARSDPIIVCSQTVLFLLGGSALRGRPVLALVGKGLMIALQATYCCNVADNDT